ncbi:ATP-grasp domain-containing protein [Salinimicrobium sp. WS361]|uniref:ATP-grasp domain-containing protein n=1 Tax=Salinimicrobium sp. WS361 TaxID=3425123 RepID=UPI003D6FEB6C
MLKPKLAIIGASYLQLPLVKKAKDMGIETHCFAWEEGAVCKKYCDHFYPVSVLDKEIILQYCRDIKINGITTIATDIAVPTISYVAEKLNLISNSYQTALWATNKGLMRGCFHNEDVSSPKFLIVEKHEEKFLEELDFPVIVKPVDRSGSRGINKVYNPEMLESAVNMALEESLSSTAIIEEYIVGDEVSVESISWQGEHYILAVTDKVTTGPPHFVELEHHQPSGKNKEILEDIVALTNQALNSLKVEYGAGHTEIKIGKNNKAYVVEVGARMGGDFIGSHLVELSTGYDFLEAVIFVALNKFTVPHFNKRTFSGVYFLCKESEKIKPYFILKNNFDVQKEIQNEELKYVTNSNDRSGYLIYCAENKPKLL